MRHRNLISFKPFILSTLVVGLGACGGAGGSTTTGPGTDDWKLGETRTVGATDPAPAGIASATGGVDFRLPVPVGVDRSRVAIGTSGSLVVGQNVRLFEPEAGQFATVSSFGSVEARSGAELGTIYAGSSSPVVIGDATSVHGFVKTVGTVNRAPTSIIDVGVLDHAEGAAQEFRWNVQFPSTNLGDRATGTAEAASRVLTAADTMLDLAPAAYGRLLVAPGSIAVLHGGTYYLDSLEVQEGGILEVDNKAPVYIWVRNSLTVNGYMVDLSPTPNVLVGYAGSAAPAISTAFHGTLIAPNADLTIPAASKVHTGSFFARNITVQDGANIEHRGFTPTDADPNVAPDSYGCSSDFQQCVQQATFVCFLVGPELALQCITVYYTYCYIVHCM